MTKINPNIKKLLQQSKKKTFTAQEYIDGILRGDRNFLSRAISVLESTKPDDRTLADRIISACLPHSGKSRRIGITGVPGVGKSTFIDVFGTFLLEKKHKIAILAIDPSSSVSGGSILGDKTRMENLAGKADVFVRPSPAGRTLGGVASKTRETILLCEAAGYDFIIVETVGVGQSETAVSSMTDLFILLAVAGTGDELQGIKRGIMEMVDILIFTKNDGQNITPTQIAKKQFEMALKMFPQKPSHWTPKVLSVSAFDRTGFDEVLQTVEQYFDLVKKNNYFEQNRKQQAVRWFEEQISFLLEQEFLQNDYVRQNFNLLKNKVLELQIAPNTAARQLIQNFFKTK